MQTCHGYRTVENLQRFIPSISQDEIPAEVERFESNILVVARENASNGQGSIVAMPGAKKLLAQINSTRPTAAVEAGNHGWAIVTSATKAYAQQGFATAGVSDPPQDLRSVSAEWKQDGSALVLTITAEEPEKGEAKGISPLAQQIQHQNDPAAKANGHA
ncbi:hypothetical protein L1887_55094 [Cichorium endivia]|nr:hypothetical protein L1887_55094 [Cichorium endivia]